MTSTIGMSSFLARYDDGATVVDVREPDEYVAGHVPGAILAPMSQIGHHLPTIPKDREVYAICQSGNRSRAMADVMARTGIRAHSVDGGTAAWIATGRPVVAGVRAR